MMHVGSKRQEYWTAIQLFSQGAFANTAIGSTCSAEAKLSVEVAHLVRTQDSGILLGDQPIPSLSGRDWWFDQIPQLCLDDLFHKNV